MDRRGNAHETEAGLLARTAINEAEPVEQRHAKAASPAFPELAAPDHWFIYVKWSQGSVLEK